MFLLVTLAGCSDLGVVRVNWTIERSGTTVSCADAGATDVEVFIVGSDSLQEPADCTLGTDDYDMYSGDRTMEVHLLDANQGVLAIERDVPFHLDDGEVT